MIASDPPIPVPIRRYRYSKLRWRVAVHALDFLGGALIWIWRRFVGAQRVESPSRILVLQLDHLGDAILSSPIFPRLRAAYPDARIDVLASSSNRAVFEADPRIDRVLLAERTWFGGRPGLADLLRAVWGLGTRLRRERYDLAIDVRGDVLSVLVMAIAGARRRLGWSMGGGGFLLTDVAAWQPLRHEVASRMALLDVLGLPAEEAPRVLAHPTDADRLRVGRRLLRAWPGRVRAAVGASRFGRSDSRASESTYEEESPLLAIHVGAGTAAKRWPRRHWGELVGRFIEEGWRVVVVGDRGEPSAFEHPAVRDWSGKLSLMEAAALLERVDLFIGVDSGPAHLAACAGVPSVVLFSGTNRVAQWRPWSRRTRVIRQKVACRPCHRKVCPLADHPCMAGITPDRVFRASMRWLRRMHHGGRAGG